MDDDYEPDPIGKSFVRPQLEYDLDEAGKRKLIVVQLPTLDDIGEALDSLDQRSRTTMTLIDGTGAYINVGGGRGQYHVYVGAFDHEDRVVLQSPARARAPRPVEIVNDGRAHSYAATDVVDRDSAFAALTEFHRNGRPHLGLTWRTG